jgi:hypothetical protein
MVPEEPGLEAKRPIAKRTSWVAQHQLQVTRHYVGQYFVWTVVFCSFLVCCVFTRSRKTSVKATAPQEEPRFQQTHLRRRKSRDHAELPSPEKEQAM